MKKYLIIALITGLSFWGLQGFVRRPVLGQPSVKAKPQPISVSQLKLDTLNRGKINLTQYKGQVVILNFFATWCPPCRLEIPHFNELQTAYTKKALIVGISVDESPELLPDFIKKQNINYPIAVQTPETNALLGKASAIPTTFIVDKNGNVVETITGYQDKAFWESKIKSLL